MIHRKTTSAAIARPIEDVFDWITTPAHWSRFSPVTLAVEAADPDRPLRAGDRVAEQIRVRKWREQYDWTVETLERPHSCVLVAGDARVEYTLTGDEHATHLTRDITLPIRMVEDLLGFARAFDDGADVAQQTIVALLENPLLHGSRPDHTADAFLHEADPLADEAVASLITATGDTTPLEQFLTGLYRGEPPLDGLPEPMQRFLQSTDTLPPWACAPMLDAASKIFLDWGTLAVGAHLCASLPETYVIPRIAKLLDLTQQLDKDPVHADRRLWFTVRMCFDVLAEHGLEPKGSGIVAVQRLRLLHAMVRLFGQRRLDAPHRLAALSGGGLWDSENGLPISQLELLHTLMTFSHVVLRSFDVWQCGLTPYQHESYIHIWNVAGFLLGIRPELLPRSAADAERIFETVKQRYAAPTPQSQRLGRALIGFWESLFPEGVRGEGVELMQYVVSTLISPETAKINGLDDLPAFPPHAAECVRGYLKVRDRLFSHLFDDVPLSQQAVALVVSLLIRKKSDTSQTESGIFDIPDVLYARWSAPR
jgi:ER-bound oxygenase mpaB/B'/Rubber oxygenase, catalytic domain/Polyketide cyclase / dehydrase and lipid transport